MFTAMHYAPIRRVRDVPVLPFPHPTISAGGRPCGVALCQGGLGSDFAMSAENDLSEEADHACFFEREVAFDEGENRFGKEPPASEGGRYNDNKKTQAPARMPAFPGYANGNAAYAKIDSSAG
jgi:hypothetical protein